MARAAGASRAALASLPADPLRLPEPGELLALAERVLEMARAAGADEAEVFVQDSRSLGVDIERTMVEGASAGGDFGLGVRLVAGGRVGFGYAAEPGKARHAVEAALHVARLSPREALRLPGPEPTGEAPRLDARIAALGPEEAAERAREVIEGARAAGKDVELSGGGIGASTEAWALANSLGLRHEERNAAVGASASAVLKGAALSTGSDHRSSRADDLDLRAIGARAARLAIDSRRPRPVDSGAYDLLLKPEAMQELLEFCCIRGLVADNVRRKESPWVGKLGQRVGSSQFSLYDDGALPGGLGSQARDDEGLPARRTPLVEKGVLRGWLHDLRSARRDEAKPTASAQRADRGEGERTFSSPPRAAGLNFSVEGPGKPLEQLIAETGRGLLVHDIIGAHTANTVTGEFHVNSALLFRVERGEVAGPCRSVMLSGSMPRWLRKLDGLSREARDLGGYSTPASLRLPWMRVPGCTVHA